VPARSYELHGVRIYECAAEGSQLRSDRHAVDLMSEAAAHGARFVVIPAERPGDDFFRLKTRIAGEVIQKFVTYGVRVAIVGDIARHLAESNSLRDFVREANRGNQCWFAADLDELSKRLEREKARAGDFGGAAK
jgi:Domain of unknown function (DUF4180)